MGSGKSTWAAQFVKDNPNTKIVSADAIRTMINGEYKYEADMDELIDAIMYDSITHILSRGLNVVVDVCNLTDERRNTWRTGIEDEVVAVMFPMKGDEWHINNRLKLTHGNDNLERRVANDKKHMAPVDENCFDRIIHVGETE
jgi:predicted kinase